MYSMNVCWKLSEWMNESWVQIAELKKPCLELTDTLQNYHLAEKISIFYILLKVHKMKVHKNEYLRHIK